jgi:hypothetical protein
LRLVPHLDTSDGSQCGLKIICRDSSDLLSYEADHSGSKRRPIGVSAAVMDIGSVGRQISSGNYRVNAARPLSGTRINRHYAGIGMGRPEDCAIKHFWKCYVAGVDG